MDMQDSPRESGTHKKIGIICARRASTNKRYQKRQSIMQERRKTYLLRERNEMIGHQLRGEYMYFECFHFGSQSEGTTILGLQSDSDLLYSSSNVHIMSVWGDWKAGILNFLMLQDDTTANQQYLLQCIRLDTPEPLISLSNNMFVKKDSGQVLFSADRWKQGIAYHDHHREKTQNGPSVSFIPNWDMVQAFHVCKTLPEIQHWIDRCRGRQWPPVQLLEAARVAPCFLVPAGNTDSDYKRE